MQNQQRHLVAILFTDIVGYTAIMQRNERDAVTIVKRYITVLQKSVSDYEGEVLNDYGDGSLCTFSSAQQAIKCAIEIQQQLQADPIVPLRVGLHIGEIFFEGEKVLGDSVNVASRIQSLGQANTILFSREIFDKIRNQPEFKCASLGLFHFKNVDDPVEVLALVMDGLQVPKREQMSGKLKEIEKKSPLKRWIVASLAIFIFAIVAFFVYSNLRNINTYNGRDRSIVVLPFDNYSNDSEQENFINGITEEITTQLSKIADIKVIGRNSSVLYKKNKTPLDQIGEKLGVAAYLEGSVQKVENKVRITAQLIDANTQKHIWAESYVRELKDIFSLQSEVAQQIAEQLHVKLTEEEKSRINKKPTDNFEAYKFYRKGRFFWDARTVASFDSAEVYYKKAIELDPEYALAYSGLADLYIYNPKGLSQLEAIPVAREYANKALLLDSTLSEALTTLGFIQSTFDYDWVKSKNTLRKAIDLNPNYPTAHLFYGNLLQYTGESTELGINEIKKALMLDPLSTNLNYVLGRNYYCAHKYDSSYGQLKKTLTLNPDFNLAKGNLAYTCLAKKNYSEAFEVIKQIDGTGTSKTAYYQGPTLSYAYAVSGDKTRARTELEKTIAKYPDQTPYHMAGVYILLNNYNEAFIKLEKAYEMRDLFMYILKVDPTFDPVRNEPRFKALLKMMNLD